MRIVLTVPEDILREACNRIAIFCSEHIVSVDRIKEIDNNVVSVANDDQEVFCANFSRAAQL